MRARPKLRLLALALLAAATPALPLRAAPETGGFTLAPETRTAAYKLSGAPSVVLHAPAGFDPKPPLHLVVFLHGFSGCVQVLASAGSSRCRPGEPAREGWDLIGRHDAAGTNTLFVIPQLAYMKRDGRPGRFAQRGYFRRFLSELLSETLAPQLGGARSLRDLGSLTLVAHSAGYEAALAILQHGEVNEYVRAVVLMDALYSETAAYARWLLSRAHADARLLSLHIGRGDPARESRALLRRVRRAIGPKRASEIELDALADALGQKRLLVARTRAAHRLVPEQHLAQVLAALPLPRR